MNIQLPKVIETYFQASEKVVYENGEIVVTAIISGNSFDAIPLDFHFTIVAQTRYENEDKTLQKT